MTQESKQLLLKDLCARLPYGVVTHATIDGDNTLLGIYNDRVFTACEEHGKHNDYPLECIKPYLRSMSNMTEEEYNSIDWEGCRHIVYYDENGFRFVKIDSFTIPVLEYLNARHFDFRYLIEKGLALEAVEGMYEIK